MSRLSGTTVTTTWNPSAITVGLRESIEVTVPGARLGDFVFASISIDIRDLQLTCTVTEDDIVTCVLSNSLSVGHNLGEFTMWVKVVPNNAF